MTISLIFTRYIALQTFFAIMATFSISLVLILFVDMIELLRRGSSLEDFGLLNALSLSALRLPNLSEKTLPFAVLFGSMFAFLKLNKRQELVIARSSGLSIWQFLRAPVVIAVLLGILAVTVLNPAGAYMSRKSQLLEAKYFGTEANLLAVSKSGLWLKQKGQSGPSIIHAQRAELNGLLLKGILAWEFNEDNSFNKRIEAPIAELHDGYWSLTHALVTLVEDNPQLHNTYRLETFLTAEQVIESFTSPDAISFWELPQFIEIAHKAGLPANRFQVHYHTLLSRPILLGAMVLVAAIFSMQVFRLGKIGRMVLGGVGSGFLLYFLTSLAEAIGSAGRVPPIIAAWSPASIALMAGVAVLLYREDG